MSPTRAERFAAILALFVGAAMLVMWSVLLLTGQAPELRSEPWRIVAHLLAEATTASVLIAGGAGLLRRGRQSRRVLLVGLGMLFYTLIASPGYYAQLGNWPMVLMFAGLLLLALAALSALLATVPQSAEEGVEKDAAFPGK